MDWTIEVVVLPVSDIDRSIAVYRDQVGFHLDHTTPGSMKALQLVVSDAKAARQELADRGVEVSDLMVMAPTDGGTFFGFSDPDANSWAVPEIKARERNPLIPEGHTGLGEWAGK